MTKQQQIDALKAELELYKIAHSELEEQNNKLKQELHTVNDRIETHEIKVSDQKLALDALYRALTLVVETGRRML